MLPEEEVYSNSILREKAVHYISVHLLHFEFLYVAVTVCYK